MPVQTAPNFSAGTPTKLFDGPYFTAFANRTYDVSPDGQRFLMIKNNASGDQASTPREYRCCPELGRGVEGESATREITLRSGEAMMCPRCARRPTG